LLSSIALGAGNRLYIDFGVMPSISREVLRPLYIEPLTT